MRALAAIALILAVAPAALAAEPQTTLPDVEDEVMCPICGTLLELSEAPQAERERAFIRARIARGDSKEEIKDALVAEYGPSVLALPENDGFGIAAYLVPVLGFAAAVGALAFGVRRWRRSPAPAGPDPAAPAGEDAARLDEDLARYDL
ncbi:MAG TPA: cytochrome c-type biogenesis protein CcmH [Solirubrobacterales bacterium]|nr:cytochrome c-type biogenesis protein CcmH [Solirubrobacterales bacterium]